jgi:hypothetical protein
MQEPAARLAVVQFAGRIHTASDGETYAHGEGSLAPGGPYETYTLERQDDGIELGVLLTRLEFGPYRRHTATVF